eukprot:scaffold17809_cov59-Phaeocystis_antarctica.AAC.2
MVGADSIRGDVQIAPTQAQRHDPQRTSTRADTVLLRPRPNPEAAELFTDQLSPIPITRAGQARSRSGRRGCSQERRAGAMRAGTSRQPACRPPAPIKPCRSSCVPAACLLLGAHTREPPLKSCHRCSRTVGQKGVRAAQQIRHHASSGQEVSQLSPQDRRVRSKVRRDRRKDCVAESGGASGEDGSCGERTGQGEAGCSGQSK